MTDDVAGERRRLARDVHDRWGSGVSLALRQVELLELYQSQERWEDAQEQIRDLRLGLQEMMAAVGRLTAELRRPEPVDCLARALTAFATAHTAGPDGGPQVEVRVDGDETALPDALRGELFLILREAVRNALKHASAQRITVIAQVSATEATATVDDDGVGFAGPARQGGSTSGHGLPSMRERAEALGGQVTVHHERARGTRIRVHVPLSGAAA